MISRSAHWCSKRAWASEEQVAHSHSLTSRENSSSNCVHISSMLARGKGIHSLVRLLNTFSWMVQYRRTPVIIPPSAVFLVVLCMAIALVNAVCLSHRHLMAK